MMSKKMFGITILHVDDVEGLFAAVDDCTKPVYMVSGEQLVDLHNGAARQTLRDTQKKGEEIANLKVYTSCDEDMMILANYLMYGRCSA